MSPVSSSEIPPEEEVEVCLIAYRFEIRRTCKIESEYHHIAKIHPETRPERTIELVEMIVPR
jgi:hypothetical protein